MPIAKHEMSRRDADAQFVGEVVLQVSEYVTPVGVFGIATTWTPLRDKRG